MPRVFHKNTPITAHTGKGKTARRSIRLSLAAASLIAAMGLVLPAYGAGGDVLWQAGDAFAGKQEAKASIVDSKGNTVVTGYQNVSGGTNDDFYTVKFLANGSVGWRAIYDKSGGSDQATSVVVDREDNVIVTGYVWNGMNNDIHTVKYNGATGAVLWQHTFNNSANGNDVGTSVTVDNLNNVYVGGYSQDSAGNNTYIVLKYATTGPNPDGHPLWQVIADGAALGINRVNSIVAGNNGVIVTGQTWNGTAFEILTVKFDFNGTNLWERRYSTGQGSCIGKFVKIDQSDNVLITGSASNGIDLDIYTAKYNGSTGAVLWEKTYNGAFDDEPNGLVIGPNGNVYVTGYTWTLSAQNDFYTAKYSGSTGTLIWDKTFNSYDGNDDITAATGIAIDPNGDLFVTGYTVSNKNFDFQTIKYKKDNGTQLWQKSFNGPANKNDRPIGIGLTPQGEVVVAGWSDTAANDLDYYVIKYDPGIIDSPTSLNAHPATNSSVDLTWVDNAGNEDGVSIERCQGSDCTSFVEIATVAANVTSYRDTGLTPNTYYSYRVRAFSGTSGYSRYSNTAQALMVVVNFVPPVWSYVLNGEAANDDYANAIAVGPDNNPVVAGQSNDYPVGYHEGLTSFDYLLVKLNRSDMSVMWSDRYNDPTDADDIATCVAVDSNNGIVVSGYATLWNGQTRDVNSLYTIRYQPNGTVLKGDQYNGPVAGGASDDRAIAVAIASASDTSNNVVVVGYGKNNETTPYLANDDIYVVKYKPDGTRDWAATPYNGNHGDDLPTAVLLAPDGSIYVTGYSETASESHHYKFFTARYNGTNGSMIWSDVFSVAENGDNRGNSIAIDATGDIYVTGYAVTASGNKDVYTIKYKGASSTVQRVWERTYNGAGNGDDAGNVVKVDPVDGGIIVAATTLTHPAEPTATPPLPPSDPDYTLIKYNATGDTLWTRTYQRPDNDDTVKAIGIDADGNIYVAGDTSNGTTTDSLTVKFDYLGNLSAATRYNGAANSFDQSTGLVINTLNEVFVAGYTENAAGNADFLVYKIAPDASAPSVPYNLTATAGYASITFGWSDRSATKDGFRVQRKVGVCSATNVNPWVPLGTTSPTTLSFTDTGLNSGSTYCYQVQTFQNSGAASRWAEKEVTTLSPSAPGSIAATVGNTTRTTLTWTDNTTGETGFRVERCTGSGCTDFATVGTTAANTTTFTDNSVCGGTSYRYRVLAYGPGWESPAAVMASVVTTTTPVAPALTATRISEAQINLTWNDPNTDETGYTLERCTGAGCTGFATLAPLAPNAVSYNDTGLPAGTTYVYRIKGYKTATCTWEVLSNAPTATSTLNPPSSLSASPANTTTVNLAWTDNTATETGFSIEKCVGAGCNSFDFVGNVGTNVSSYSDVSACTGETATYRVKSTRGTVSLSNDGGSCWTRRMPLTISNFQANYQIKLTVPYDVDMKTTFADLRFVDVTGGVELPYWIESKTDGSTATVWVKTGINNDIALYFGNASATSSSNGTSVFEFFDEFTGTLDSTKWAATGSYSVSGGALQVNTGSVYSKATVASSPQNRVFEMKSQWLNGTSSYSGINIANAQSTQGSNAGSNALAYFITDGGTTANLLPFGATGSAASYNIASGTLSSTISTGGALYNPFLSNYQNTRKPASGFWSPPGGGNITRVHITLASEGGYDYYSVYNAAGTLLWKSSGTADTWLDVAPTTGIYTIFTTDGSVQRGVGGDVTEVVVDGISAINALNNYRIVGFEFQGTSQVSYFVKELNYSDVLRKTYTGTWNSAPYLWLGYYTGAAAGATDGDDMLVDWARVRKYAATEPVATLGAKESSTCYTFGSPWDGTYSATATATTPQPTTPVLTATRYSDAQINLSWTDTNTDRSGFSLERCTGSGCSDFSVIAASIPAGTLSYSDTSALAVNTTYTYRVSTFKTAPCGWSRASNSATATTTLYGPTNIAATVNNSTQITVTWTDQSASETGFKILRCQGSGCTPSATDLIGTALANATSYVDTSVSENTTYNYQVVATNSTALWDSTASAKIEKATTAATLPVLSSVTRASEVQINVSWTDTNTDRSGFRLYRCAGASCSNFAQVGGTITATSYSDTGLTPNTSYTYYVETFKTANPGSWAKQSTQQLSATTTILEPNSLSATSNTTQIVLSWADRTASETGFKVYRCQGAGCTPDTVTPYATPAAGATSYTDTNVAENTTYAYQVMAYNSTVPWNSALSTKLEKSTLAAAAPILSASSPNEVQINLSWTDPNTDETGFKVYRCTGTGCSDFTLLATGTLSANTTTFNNTGLTTGTSYSYQVHAYKTATNSWDKVSNTVTLTPAVAGPTNLKVTAVTTTSVSLSWTDTTGSETGFDIERWDGSAFVKINGVGANVTSYTDSTVCNGQSYIYQVRAVNTTVPWNSTYSNTTIGIPASNTNLLVDANFENAATSWTTAVNTTTGTSFDTTTFKDGGTSLKLAATGTQSGRSQSVTVVAGRQYVLSGWVNSALTAGTAQCDVYGTGIDSPGIAISYGGANNNAGWVNLSETVTIPAGTTSVSVRCFANTGTQGSAYIDGVSFAPANFALTATRASENQINLSWLDSVVDETGYKIERCAVATCTDTDYTQIATAAANATSYSSTGLNADITYTYRVRGYKTASCSWDGSYSATASATTTITPPSNFTATATNTTTVNLAWTDNTVSETGFRIERCTGSTCVDADYALLFTTAANATAYSDTSVANGTSYQYRIRATNSTASWNSAYTYTTVPIVTTPTALAPTPLTATRGSNETLMTLNWTDKTTDETGYKVERCEGVGCSTYAVLNGSLAANTATYADTGLKGNTSYTWRVSAYKTATSSWTASNTVTMLTTVTAPSSLAASAPTSSQVNLTWTDNSATETGFKIERCTGSGCSDFTEIATPAANVVSYSDTSVTQGTTYSYRIRATNSSVPWDSGYSNTATVSTPAVGVPSGLSTTYIGSRVTLTWTRNTVDETGFTIQRCTGATCLDTDYTQIGQTAANVTTYQDSTVCAGTTYSYRVSAYRTGTPVYTTPYSPATTVTPNAALPVLTVTRASEAQLNLSWTDSNTDKNGFRVERCIGSGCSSFALTADNLASNVMTYSDTGLLPNYTYTYRIRTFNNTATCGWETTGAAASGATTVVAPTGLSATTSGMSQINLSWTDTSATKTGSKIERCAGSGCSSFTEVGTVSGTATTWSDTGLTAGTNYTYRVRSTKSTSYAWDSDYSNTASATTQTVPAAPTGLTATAASAGQIDLAWSDTSAPDGYYLESCTGSNCSNFTQVANVPGAKNYSRTGLVPETTYCFRVRGYKTSSWTSAYSNPACATTTIDSPSTLTARAVNSQVMQLSWVDSTAEVNGYNVESQLWNGEWVVLASLGPDATSYTDAVGIEATKSYTYRVRGFKGSQLSTYSNPVTVTAPAFKSSDTPCVVADADAPVISSVPVTTATEGTPYTYQVLASSVGNRAIYYLLAVKPVGMEISPTGLITWTPAFSQAGDRNVTVRLFDSEGHMADQHFSITVTNVNHAPVITSTPATTAVELHPYTYQVTANDQEGDALTYTLTTSPTGMTITSVGLINWTPATAQFGSNNVTVQVTDGSFVTPQTFTVNVGHNQAPSISSTAVITAAEGSVYFYQVAATDPDGDPLTYTLTSAPAGMSISSTGLVTWTPTLAQGQTGTASVSILVTDGGLSATQSYTITVDINHTPVILSSPVTSASEGVGYTYAVQSYAPVQTDTVTYSLTTAPAGMTISSSGVITWTPSAGQGGSSIPVTVKVMAGGAFTTQSYTIAAPSIPAPATQRASVGSAYSFTAIANAAGRSGTIAYSLVTAPTGMTINSTTGVIGWTPAAGQTGSNTVTVKATIGAYTPAVYATRTFTVAVPYITSTAPTTGTVGAQYFYTVAATDPAGGTISYALTTSPAGMAINSSTGAITWTPASTQGGDNTVTISASVGGATATQSFTVSVLKISSIPGTSAYSNWAYSYQVTTQGTPTGYYLDTAPTGMTINATTGAIAWTPTSGQTGSNPVAVRVTTTGNTSVTQSFTILVASAPSAPILTAPTSGTAYSGGYAGSGPPVPLTWNAIAGAQYSVVVSTDATFATTSYSSGWISEAAWSPTVVPGATTQTYYWKVQARDPISLLTTAWSGSWNFSVTDTCGGDVCCGDFCCQNPTDPSCGGGSTSCPLVYSYNGSQFTYESDLAGPVISQYPKGPRAVSIYQPIYMPLERLVPDADNRYQVKIWESLNEGTSLDEAKLLAVDYPAGYEIASSSMENTYYNGIANPFKLYTLKNPVLPISAIDKNGADVLSTLRSVDDIPAPMTPNASDNYYILDFGKIQHPEYAKLVIDGWMIINSKLYTNPTFIKPYIEVKDANGAWVNVKTIGMPAGDLKTMVIDLSNVFLSSDHRIKLNLGVRKTTIWVADRIRLDDSAPVTVTTQELTATSADLQAGGQAIVEMSTPQHRIHVGDNLPIKPDFYGYGSFTRYGEVKDLVAQRDDKFVLMNYGDKLEMKFPALPAPQQGMSRAFLIKADLWYKEFKDYKYLEPLPFHGMSDYPYPSTESYPTDEEHNLYRQLYNTRQVNP